MKSKLLGLTENDFRVLSKVIHAVNRAEDIPTKQRHRARLELTTTYGLPFALDIDEENNLTISPGFLNRNGEFLDVKEAKIKPIKGYICVCSTIVETGWTVPKLEIHSKPAADKYPIGFCDVDDKDPDSITLTPYYQPVAIIMLAKLCPMAVNKNG